MKFVIGFAAGVAAAWAALAIWQRAPEFPDLGAGEVPEIEPSPAPWVERPVPARWRDDPDVDANGLWSGFGGGR